VTLNQAPHGSGGQEFETLTVRVTRDMAEQFRAVAAREDRPVAAELRRLIRMRIDEKDPNGHDEPVAA